MSNLPDQRPTQGTREQVIEKLTLNYAHNNIDDEEFESRLSRATNTDSVTELMMLVEDLPNFAETKKQVARKQPSESSVSLNTGVVREEGSLVALLGSTSRKGVWQPPRDLRIFAMMGGVDLDFTDAEMPPGTTEVTIFSVMGGIDIVVPPGLNVEVTGIPLMGSFDDRSSGMVNPDAPTLRVKGVAIMSGVDVKLPKKYRKLLANRRRERRRDED
ncbi:MAG TPA: LiaF domain-containing protein [Spirochaetia bacterium]|nr:LiaF domain-containing protein [Spirochaetia bacterium]